MVLAKEQQDQPAGTHGCATSSPLLPVPWAPNPATRGTASQQLPLPPQDAPPCLGKRNHTYRCVCGRYDGQQSQAHVLCINTHLYSYWWSQELDRKPSVYPQALPSPCPVWLDLNHVRFHLIDSCPATRVQVAGDQPAASLHRLSWSSSPQAPPQRGLQWEGGCSVDSHWLPQAHLPPRPRSIYTWRLVWGMKREEEKRQDWDRDSTAAEPRAHHHPRQIEP